jgi:hypothetical protein
MAFKLSLEVLFAEDQGRHHKNMNSHLVVKVQPLSCYSFGKKEAKVDKDIFLSDRLDRMRAK